MTTAAADKIFRLGDALDTVERAFIVEHPNRLREEAIWNGEVGDAYDRYRKAARIEVTRRKRAPSVYCDLLAQMKFIGEAKSLKEKVDSEMQRVLQSYQLRQNEERREELRARKAVRIERAKHARFRVRW
ncbi:MAG TPA: hypothetical protein VL048_03830 [Xanthobacteraceae bacterium]|nr:hypothetical protein [Xanthobacteraceae bacterium]